MNGQPEQYSMPAETVLSVGHISKKFCRRLRRSMVYGIADLARDFAGIPARSGVLRKEEFWALDDVSLELRRGETLGVIGVNGSGKTTLLRLLAGIFPPDKGEIVVRGRVGALISLGAGFHPNMSGLENIYLNGSIMGLSRAELDAKRDTIVDFADLGDFIHAPVSTYSSGMRVRLGFAIAVSAEPDVLLVDEVLAVGDFKFRQKCAERIGRLRQRAGVVLVSHTMRDILMLATKAVVMDTGRIVFLGSPREAIDCYLKSSEAPNVPAEAGPDTPAGAGTVYGETFLRQSRISDVKHIWVDAAGNESRAAGYGEAFECRFSFKLEAPVENLIVAVPVWDSNGILITSLNSDATRTGMRAGAGETVSGALRIDHLPLNPGQYTSMLVVHDGRECLYRDFVHPFKVKGMPVYHGFITPEHEWQFKGTH